MQRQLLVCGGGVIIAAGAIAGGAFGLDRWADHRVKQGLTHQVEAITGTLTQVQSVDANLWRGTLEVQDLTLENPDHFASDDLLKVGEITAQIPAAQIFSATPVVSEVVIRDLNLQFDQKLNRNNLLEVMAQVEETLTQKQQAGTLPTFEAKRVQIQAATVTLTLELGIPGVPTASKTLPLQDFELTHVTQATLPTQLSQVMQAEILAAAQQWLTAEAQKWGAIAANLALQTIQESIKAYLARLAL